ncbi:RNA-directed DNA polymerase, eukaryota, reverse transcriptase zinc-binding domain protein [Tanacetum coccineum]
MIGNKVFGRWSWCDNAYVCKSGCRIMIVRNTDVAKCMVLHATNQAMLCLVEVMSTMKKLYCCFIHAENDGRIRRILWNDLINFKAISSNNPMVIMGDMNVSLNLEDHTVCMSCITQDIEEFQDYVNALKMKDICSTGFHFTWTKSLTNHVAGILKKIDRVMGSEEFMEIHNKAYVVFLPYGISDHCPAILTCAQLLKAKPKSSRFDNYITDKEEFSQVVSDKWSIDAISFNMFKLRSLDDLQRDIDKDPHNAQLRSSGVQLLPEYTAAIEDEEKLFRVEEICGEDNTRYVGDQVPIQFVNHFQKFTGAKKDKECLAMDPELFTNKISDLDSFNMVGEVTNNEIKVSICDINDNKSPGPDGFTSKFFIKAWHTVGDDITDNNLLTQELLKGYDCKNGPKRCSMKIDIQKAYDTVEWKFLEDALRSMNKGAIEEILKIIPFKRGKLLVRYLGVPLVSKKISVKDCKNLVDKVKARVNDWKNNSLSYARRTQLIASVLASIQVLMGDEVRSHMQFRIGNGKDVSIWHNRWCCLPAIDTIVSRREVYVAGFSNKDTIADCIFENKWKWPAEWYDKYPILHQYNVPNVSIGLKDKLIWISNNGTEKEYASNHVWKDIRFLNDKVQWWKVIWFTQNIPRNAFVTWMAIKGKLFWSEFLVRTATKYEGYAGYGLDIKSSRLLGTSRGPYNLTT